MTDKLREHAHSDAAKVEGIGCAGTLAGINVILMGLIVSTFAVRPYSSVGQAAWYRVGSIGFLCIGAILPGAALIFAARRHPMVVKVAIVWMFAASLLFAGYVLASGGGM